ncbi:hypothetical protein VPH35_108351 [Triticum aestivum]
MAGGAAEELQIRVEQAALEHGHRLLPRQHDPRETAAPPIHDELLLDIFLRIPDLADIVRTSAACVPYRKRHAPPLLGLLDTCRIFHLAEPPHPSSSAARVVALAANFSFSFPPTPAHHWVVQDSRDGRILLQGTCSQHHNDWPRKVLDFFQEIAVCDPLHRRYLVLPPVSDDLAAAMVQEQDPVCKYEAFLIPPDNDKAATSIKVMWMGQSKTKLFAFVFSSTTGQWLAIPSMTWIDLLPGFPYSTNNTRFYFHTYTSRCFYWVTKSVHWMEVMKMLVFDTRRMEFSIADPPEEARRSHGIAMVEAGEGRLGMFLLESGPLYFSLHYTIKQNSAGSTGQWQREKTISLTPGACYELSPDSSYELASSVEDRYLLLLRRGTSRKNSSCFTLDSRTFQLQRVCSEQSGHAYSTHEVAEKEMLEQSMEVL